MRNRYLISACFLFAAFFIDQFSKRWGEDLHLSTIMYNQGFIMGYFSNQPDSIRVVALSFFAAILFIIYTLLLFTIPLRAKILSFGLSVLMGGMLGNVIDKMTYGYTIDFIPFRLGKFSVVYNLADVFIWLGTLVVLWVVFRRDKLLWFEGSTRKRFLINPKEQLRYGLQVTLIVFNTCLLLGFFSYSFIQSYLPRKNSVMTPFALAFTSITVFLCLLSFLTGIFLSHRSSGAVYAFEVFVNDLISGKDRDFKLRERDHYQHLHLTAQKLRNHLKDNNTDIDKKKT